MTQISHPDTPSSPDPEPGMPPLELAPEPLRKYVFAASTGGHLAQLVRLSARLQPHPDSLWITFRSEQSESLLQGRRVLFVPYIASRDLRGVLKAVPKVHKAFREERFDEVVSTGSALAVPVMVLARLGSSMQRTYVESVARVAGPSLTGRILAAFRLARLHTQYPGWASARWQLTESVLALFATVPGRSPAAGRSLRILVTLGTIKPYRFDALIDRVLTIAPGAEIAWQLGSTGRTDLPGVVHEMVSQADLLRLASEADVVITHAGVGSILGLLDMGIHPVVIPRRSGRGEHVDDHQMQISGLVADLGVATVAEATELTLEHLQTAAGLRVVSAT